MDHPNRSVFEMLNNLYLRVQERDVNGFAHDRVRILVRDYEAWLHGSWDVNPDRALEILNEEWSVAIDECHNAGLEDLAATLVAIRPRDE
jgi:hypothetical protein